MIIEHEGKRYEVSFIDYLYGEPGPFGVNSVLHVIRELPAETTITRAEFKKQIGRGWEVRMTPGVLWTIVTGRDGKGIFGTPPGVPGYMDIHILGLNDFYSTRRPGSSVELTIIDPPPPAPEFVSTDGRRFTLKEGKLV